MNFLKDWWYIFRFLWTVPTFYFWLCFVGIGINGTVNSWLEGNVGGTLLTMLVTIFMLFFPSFYVTFQARKGFGGARVWNK